MVKKFNKFGPQLVFAEQTESAIALTNEQKLSIYKKSQKSGISTDILEEVYRRGYHIWNESFGQTADQFAFDRVNSFIAGGFAAELDEDLMEKIKEPTGKLKDACWTGYTAVGMKMKNGRKVPNCVPVKEDAQPLEEMPSQHRSSAGSGRNTNPNLSRLARKLSLEKPRYFRPSDKPSKAEEREEAKKLTAGVAVTKLPAGKARMKEELEIEEAKKIKFPHDTSKHFKTSETAELQSVDPNDPDSRFDGTTSATNVYKKTTPGQSMKESTYNIIRKTISEATYKGRKVSLNKPFRTPGGPKKSAVYVDPDGDGKAKIVRFGDPNLSIKKNQPARKRSYCARSSGQGNLTKKDSANYWSRRAWNCEETINELSVPAGTTGKRTSVSTPMVAIRMASGKIEKHPPGKSGSSGGGGDEE